MSARIRRAMASLVIITFPSASEQRSKSTKKCLSFLFSASDESNIRLNSFTYIFRFLLILDFAPANPAEIFELFEVSRPPHSGKGNLHRFQNLLWLKTLQKC